MPYSLGLAARASNARAGKRNTKDTRGRDAGHTFLRHTFYRSSVVLLYRRFGLAVGNERCPPWTIYPNGQHVKYDVVRGKGSLRSSAMSFDWLRAESIGAGNGHRSIDGSIYRWTIVIDG